jgi:ubiquinone/menaquinone biosynthesis C-methylase UbiE
VKSKDLYPSIFSRHAQAYDRRLDQLMSSGEARGRQRVLDLIDARPGMRILDLACGPGNLARRLAAAVAPGGEVVGVDLAPGMIEVARSLAIPNARFELMDIEELSFPSGSFDAAACGHGLQFVPHLDRALSEAHRVLRHSSRFAASVPVGSPSQGVLSLLDAVVDRHLPAAPRAVDQDETRRTIADPDLLSRAARDAGFADARVEVLEETVVWQSAEQLVALCTSWWDCAARLERLTEEQRAAFIDDALDTLHGSHTGTIETASRSLVLDATA